MDIFFFHALCFSHHRSNVRYSTSKLLIDELHYSVTEQQPRSQFLFFFRGVGQGEKRPWKRGLLDELVVTFLEELFLNLY